MLNRHLLLASCIAATGLLGLPAWSADGVSVTESRTTEVYPKTTTTTDIQDASTLQLPPGIMATTKNVDTTIHKSFEALADAALTKNGFDSVVNTLVDQDRDRLKKSLGNASLTNVDGNKNQKLNDLAKSLSDTWHTKYNTKFNVDEKMLGSTFVQIKTGEVTDPAALVGKWPVAASPIAMDKGGKVTPADAQQAKDKAFGGDVNLEKGRNVAVAMIPASHGLPAIHASLIHENLGGYKFDIPNTISAQKLYDNLVANLSYLDQHKDQLPSDVNEGYRQVTHAIVAAIYDINLESGAGTAKMPMDSGAVRPTGTSVDNR